MLHVLDRAQHLRTDVAGLHALEVAPSMQPLCFEPPLERFREFASVRARIGDEDRVGRERHGADNYCKCGMSTTAAICCDAMSAVGTNRVAS